jgi:uncharacterized membrane protein YgdD (TMEM256/DUF423 family)
MNWVVVGSLSALVGVVMGAFGAHAVSGRFSDKAFAIYQTAAQYQMYHALALIAFGLLARQAQTAGWCFLVGTVVFSGSLYALALTDVKLLGAITPIGGILFIVGWAMFAYEASYGQG